MARASSPLAGEWTALGRLRRGRLSSRKSQVPPPGEGSGEGWRMLLLAAAAALLRLNDFPETDDLLSLEVREGREDERDLSL